MLIRSRNGDKKPAHCRLGDYALFRVNNEGAVTQRVGCIIL